MSLAVVFGANIRSCRKARCLAQAELGEKISHSTKIITKIEHEVTSPSFSTGEEIHEALACSKCELFNADTIANVGDQRAQVLKNPN